LICLICRQAEIVDGLTSITFERGEMKIRVEKVPARNCPHCGEAYVEEEVAVRLLQDLEEILDAGFLDIIRDYRSGWQHNQE
jgi:YgiT-type zinc finger domain-containing protein